MAQKTDYSRISIPSDKDPKNYTCTERRAYEHTLLMQEGTFDVLHTIKLGLHFGVNPSTISRDRTVLEDYVFEAFNKSNILPEVITTKRWAVKEARSAGDYAAADRVSDSILKMAQDLGILDRVADKLELETRDKSLEDILKNKKKVGKSE